MRLAIGDRFDEVCQFQGHLIVLKMLRLSICYTAPVTPASASASAPAPLASSNRGRSILAGRDCLDRQR
jgi:hypothetical protein